MIQSLKMKGHVMSEQELISTTKAAKRLNVTPNTIRSLIADGKFKGYKIGRLVKVDAQQVEEYLASIHR